MKIARGRRGAGRRPGQSSTRAQILTAALDLFAAKGYASTTMREIAQRAEVDPALIHHFFGNKDGLFREAASCRVGISALFESLTEGTEEEREDLVTPLMIKECCDKR
ncbi:TetR/AcrR family transcriptional regulator [Streptomyces sp. NPDC017964]|uniref:TetR/AcrR family transcriptional regulator n=1 Tax=Streptomyces sp. NPDC017964 TaxID=3365022 RepID=UPI0037A5A20D